MEYGIHAIKSRRHGVLLDDCRVTLARSNFSRWMDIPGRPSPDMQGPLGNGHRLRTTTTLGLGHSGESSPPPFQIDQVVAEMHKVDASAEDLVLQSIASCF